MGNSARQIADNIKEIIEKMEFLKNKIIVFDRNQIEREQDYPALLELTEKEFCLRFRAIPENVDKSIKERTVQVWLLF